MLVTLIFFTCQLFFISIQADTCSWENCPKWNNNLLNVHFISHTHDDMGWLKTVDDYYTGAHMDILHIGVQYIINTVIDELLKNEARKFSYCETGFLKRWIDDHPDIVNSTLVKLVQNGQLEIIGGGWTQPDEAASHYIELIDMYTLGLTIQDQAFGRCGHPKVAWQIDPFGHSREHANLVKLMGYESLYFWREHYSEHDLRVQNKSLQFNWKVSEDNGNSIFTGAFYGDYCAPAGLNWEWVDPIIDNPEFENYNLDARLDSFVGYIKEIQATQLHNHIMILMGCDFTYMNANQWFTNTDKLIYHLNKRFSNNLTAFYSTPTCYTQALNGLNINWPVKNDDFFPYASSTQGYWTGYFTSKPAMKGLVRKSSSLLQLTRQLNSLALTLNPAIEKLERAVSTSMHHDAVTGTSREAVTQDYIYRLLNGWTSAEQVINAAIQNISQNLKKNSEVLPTQIICRNLNESECIFTKNNTHYMVTVHNSNGQNLETLIKVPLYQNVNTVTISDANGNTVNYQIVPVFNNPGQINNPNIATNEIWFTANVNPVGFQTYFITVPANLQSVVSEELNIKNDAAQNTISNGLIQLDFDSQGYLSSLTDLTINKVYSIKQEFQYYIGYPGIANEQPSGAYVFRPYQNTSNGFTGPVQLAIVQGSLINEARQIVSPWISQTIRLLPNKTYVEFEWTIGPIPTEDKNSKEVITRYTLTGLNSNGVFWTDANGRQLMKRIRNHKDDYQYINHEPISANYYPINSRIILNDETTSMAILTDRSHGGGSIADGQVEIMLHRRDLYDDNFGVYQALNEPGRDGRGLVVRGKHWLIVGNQSYITRQHRTLAYEKFHSPILTFSTYDSDQTYRTKYATEYSGLGQPLPPNINLLTLKQISSNTILLRLEHFYQTNEDPIMSKPASLDLSNLFPDFTVIKTQEMSLAANDVVGNITNTLVTLNPMEIKTYQITVQRNTQCFKTGNTCTKGGDCCSGLCFNLQCY